MSDPRPGRILFQRWFARILSLAALFSLFTGCATTGLEKTSVPSVPSAKKIAGPARVHWTVKTTAYSHGEASHRPYARNNAVGGHLQSGAMTSASADWSKFPAGTVFYSPDTGKKYIIDDYGSALVGTETIDLYMPTLGQMRNWGVRRIQIDVIKWGDRQRSLALLRPRQKYGYIRRMVASLENSVERFPKRY